VYSRISNPVCVAAIVTSLGAHWLVAGGAVSTAPGSDVGKEDLMGIILVLLLLALLFGALGFAIHVLWIVAVVFFVVWIVGFALGRGRSRGARTG
jgi:hypothetical protein